MKKIMYIVPLVLGLVACNDEAENVKSTETVETPVTQQTEAQGVSLAANAQWEVDERLQEPTENTTCYMCNMKVYTRDTEQGVFAAQAVRENGEVVFYDDIGCLLNDEYANDVENEKFVRDYVTLNWFNVDEAIVVKTDMKSPMNWGYIFFKYEEDADVFLAEHKTAEITPLAQVREEAATRYDKKHAKDGEMEMDSDMEEQSSEGHAM